MPHGKVLGLDERAAAILDFWFGPLDGAGLADDAHRDRWFGKDDRFDDTIRERFAPDVEAALAGGRIAWLAQPHGCLAYVITLDQFPRNVHRGGSRMFAGDELALAAAESALARGLDRPLALAHRGFLYMPFMHSEDLDRQRRSVELFRALVASAPPAARAYAQASLDFAVRHRDIVARFGRFPHRNAILGRTSTPDEVDFLEQPGSSF